MKYTRINNSKTTIRRASVFAIAMLSIAPFAVPMMCLQQTALAGASDSSEGWISLLNDQLLHEDVVMDKETPGGVENKESPRGPLMFQGNHGPVAYRNIVVKPVKK